MTKFADKSFSSRPATDAYRMGWGQTFVVKPKTRAGFERAVAKAQKAGGGVVIVPPGVYDMRRKAKKR